MHCRLLKTEFLQTLAFSNGINKGIGGSISSQVPNDSLGRELMQIFSEHHQKHLERQAKSQEEKDREEKEYKNAKRKNFQRIKQDCLTAKLQGIIEK